MAKAIKHITAGLLNIEVIGQVPESDTKRRPRSRSGRPTSAAMQFYNNKKSWQELELWLAANFGSSDMVVTLTYDNEHLPADKAAGDKQLKKFFRKLRDTRKKRGQDLKYIYATEGYHGAIADSYFGDDRELEDKRVHHHVVLNRVSAGDMDEIRSLWGFGGYVRIEPLDVHYYRELAKYITKEAREFGRAKLGEHTWRRSKNLTKYEVEYIEIPCDSVTLTAPVGAVDYQQWSETNPFGFAPCTGARYLLFTAAAFTTLSYAQGRR